MAVGDCIIAVHIPNRNKSDPPNITIATVSSSDLHHKYMNESKSSQHRVYSSFLRYVDSVQKLANVLPLHENSLVDESSWREEGQSITHTRTVYRISEMKTFQRVTSDGCNSQSHA